MDTWKDKFVKLVNKINKKRGWQCDDMNPFFYQINLLNFSNAKTCTGQKCKDCLLCYKKDTTSIIVEKVKTYGKKKLQKILTK